MPAIAATDGRGCLQLVAWVAANALLLRPLAAAVNRRAFGRCPGPPAAFQRRGSGGLRAVVSGGAKTGTTSLQVAMEALGLRTYKTDELLTFMPESLVPGVQPEALARLISACRVEAVAPEPNLHLVPRLLHLSPDALVVHSVRPADECRRSFANGYAPWRREMLYVQVASRLLCHWLPLGLLWLPGDAEMGTSYVGGGLLSMMTSWCVYSYYDLKQGHQTEPAGDGRSGGAAAAAHVDWVGLWCFGPSHLDCVAVAESGPGLVGTEQRKGIRGNGTFQGAEIRWTWPDGSPWAGTHLGSANGSVITWRAGSRWVRREDAEFNIRAQWRADSVKGLVPPEQLLEFDVQRHGWAELAAFLGRPPPPEGTAFPRVRVGSSGHEAVKWALSPSSYVGFCLLCLASVAANWALLAAAASLPLGQGREGSPRRGLGRGRGGAGRGR